LEPKKKIVGVPVMKVDRSWICPLCDQSLKVIEPASYEVSEYVAWCSVCNLDIWNHHARPEEKEFALDEREITLEEIMRLKKLKAFK